MPSTRTDLIDGVSTSVAYKAPCRTVAATNITLSGLQTVGGVSVVAGDRVLVMGQTNAVNNGIYVVSSSAWTRAKDFDGNRDVVDGTAVFVVSNAGEYRVTTDNPITIGTSSINFELIERAAVDVDVVFDTITELKAQTGTPESFVVVLGRSTLADGGGPRIFQWHSTNTDTADDVVTVKVTSLATGRYKILDDGFWNVKWWGAKGDGVTDDTAAIQAAVDYANNQGGGTVRVPTGTYICTSAITLYDLVNVEGAGKSCTILRFTAATNGFYAASPPYLRIKITDLQLQAANAACLSAIKLDGTANGGIACLIENIEISSLTLFTHFWDYGIWLSNIQVSRIVGVRCYIAGQVGAHLEYGCNQTNFYNCEFVGYSGSSTTRAIEATAAGGAFEFHMYGCTLQGHWDASLIYANTIAVKAFGLHLENTNATPSDGADVYVVGTVNSSFAGLQGGSILTSGTMRNLVISHSEVAAITIGTGGIATLIGVRYVSFTDTDGLSTVIGCVSSGGGLVPAHLVDAVSYRQSLPTISNNSTTPAIVDTEMVQFSNTLATNITKITGGRVGQLLTIYALSANNTFVDVSGGGNFVLAGSVNFTPTIQSTLTLRCLGSDFWVEVARAVTS